MIWQCDSFDLNYHMNRWTFPGSLAHSNPLYKNKYPVTRLTTANHEVSINSLTSSPQITLQSQSFLVILFAASLSVSGGESPSDSEVWTEGTCNLQNSQGRMKYRGSTSGAETSERVVVASQTITKETRQPKGETHANVLLSAVGILV